MTRCEIVNVYPARAPLDERRALLAVVEHPNIPYLDGSIEGESYYYLPIKRGGGMVIGSGEHDIVEENRNIYLSNMIPKAFGPPPMAFVRCALLDNPFIVCENKGTLKETYDLNAFLPIGPVKKGDLFGDEDRFMEETLSGQVCLSEKSIRGTCAPYWEPCAGATVRRAALSRGRRYNRLRLHTARRASSARKAL